MYLKTALQHWSDSCAAEPASKDGSKFAPADNRRPLSNALRHCPTAKLEVVKGASLPPGWAALVLVTPAEPKPHAATEGEAPPPTPPRRKPFHLFVG